MGVIARYLRGSRYSATQRTNRDLRSPRRLFLLLSDRFESRTFFLLHQRPSGPPPEVVDSLVFIIAEMVEVGNEILALQETAHRRMFIFAWAPNLAAARAVTLYLKAWHSDGGRKGLPCS
jgi:hypothetical protein